MKWKTFSMLIAALWLWGSCNDDEINRVENPVQTGEEITFGFSLSEDVKTRTTYGDEAQREDGTKYYPVYWENGDEIAIFCPQAVQPASQLVNYTITPDEFDATTSSAVTRIGDVGLQWGEGEGELGEHRFYGFYPASAVKGTETDGIIKANIPVYQMVESWSYDQESGTYIGNPNYDLAYMFAYTAVNKAEIEQGDDIPLTFRSLVTILEITVNGPIENSAPIQVSAININAVEGDNVALAGNFDCKINDKSGTCTPSNDNTVRNRVTISCYDNEKDEFITLKPGEKLKVRAFIIPDTENPIQPRKLSITVSILNGAAKTKTLETAEIVPHKVNFVNLPALTSGGVNYWMSDLDPNIYVTELSLPGSKMSMLTSANRSNIVYQNATIEEQLQAGVRAFIFQTQRMYDGEIHISANGNNLNISLSQSLEEIADFLTTAESAGKKESAFVLVTYNGGNGSENDWMRAVQQIINTCANDPTYRIFNDDLSPNTTLGDVTGKIIVKANYNSADMIAGVGTAPMLYTLWEKPYEEGGLPMTWNDPNGAKAFTWLYQEVTSVVDADRNENRGYSAEATEAQKRQYITEIFQKSVDAYKNNDAHDTWFMNDLGGYYCYQTEITGLFGIHLGWEDHIDPSGLATDMNNLGVQLLQERTENAALGLVYMNFADRDANSGQLYKSDWLIQTVIDNNFKFALRKATDATTASQTATTKTTNPNGWDE